MLAIVVIACALLGILCSVFPKLAIPAMMLGIISYLAIPKKDSERFLKQAALFKAGRVLMLLAVPCILVGLFRFAIVEAMPGIIEAGREALTTRAIAALREIRFSQDLMREQHYADHDDDGIGSAGTLAELCAVEPLRAGKLPSRLVQRFSVFDKSKSPGSEGAVFARYAGYGFIIYVPTLDGKASAIVKGKSVDDEKAERRFVAYAWPLDEGHGEHPVLFLDEHERIYMSDNVAQRYRGSEVVPKFDAALGESSIDFVHDGSEVKGQDGALWKVWKDKKPLEKLAGDDAAQ